MATNFPANPSNGDTHAGFTFNSATGAWESSAVTPPAQDPAVTVYATVDDLPTSGVTTGQQAFVSATNRLYIWNSSGWYNIALINTTPSISGASASYELATDGTPTVVTITASDPEGLPITYDIVSDTSGNTATVTSNNNIFTITPTTNNADAGTFSLTFRASDGVNIASAISEFTLAFQVQNSNYTTALITSVGTNNQVNNDFVDSSTNSHTITAAGNATQTTFSPYRHGGNAVYFGGDNSGSYGQILLDTAMVPATGSWTFEAWVQPKNRSVNHTVLSWYEIGANGRGYIQIRNNADTTGEGCVTIISVPSSGTSLSITSTTRVDDGAWHHIAVERDGNVFSIWVDGTREAQTTVSISLYTGINTRIGHTARSDGGPHFNYGGLMRDVRFSTSAKYSGASTISVPTEDESSTTGYDLLCLQSFNPFIDKTGNRTLTVQSSSSYPVEQVGSGPYDYETYSATDNGGSIYFDGSGDYLSVPDDASLDLGTGDFTIEGWVWIDSASVDYAGLLGKRSQTGWNAGDWRIAYRTSGVIDFDSNLGAGPATPSVKINSWNHFAFCRSGTTIYPFMNGSQGTPVTGYTYTLDNTESLLIGRNTPNYDIKGSLTNIRIVKGTALYTSSFTPPTAPLTAISGTELLINGTNAGIIDKSQSVKSLTLNGDIKSSTTQTKYLTSSMAFDGTGDYVSVPYSSLFDLGTQDFTVELWANFSANSGVIPLVGLGQGGSSASTAGWTLIQHGTWGGLTWYRYNGSSETYYTKSWSPSTNTWYHVAVSRQGTDLRFFIDGTSIGTQASVSTSYNNINTSDDLWIGRNRTGNGSTYLHFNGYMSDIRITKGLARYTANFTPPTAALQG